VVAQQFLEGTVRIWYCTPMARCARILISLVLLAAACGGPPPTRLDRLYRGLDESLPAIDPTILEGRRILVDPGHGGRFRGTMGRDSLEESSVNLGVSLYLWGLLRESGAEVYLTRAIDKDFLSEADSSLASDLQARVAMADSLEPDIFISIHHNAQPQRDPGTNMVETYYKAGDPASLDLAFSIHRHLMRNLGIETGEVRQGNYYVLRENDIPSVLGESSYLTHPEVENKVKLSDVQRLEAEAYFLGILDYFGRGIPRIAAAPFDSVQTEVPTLAWLLSDDGGDGIDPDGIDVTVAGTPVTPWQEPSPGGLQVWYSLDRDAPNGAYTVSMLARNMGGNTSHVHHTDFVLELAAQTAVFDVTPATLPPGTPGVARVRVRLLDRRGLPIAPGTRVSAAIPGNAADIPGTTDAAGVFEFPVRHGADGAVTVAVTCGDTGFRHSIERTGRPSSGVQVPPPPMWETFVLVDATSGTPVDEAVIGNSTRVPEHAGDGRYYTYAPPGRVHARGYLPWAGSIDGDTLALTPWFGGVLHGRRFVLDPEGGRSTEVGAGKLGLSANAVNLRVARYLAGYLRDAGADVLMTRVNEEIRTPEDIARNTNRWGADRYIEIRHRAAPSDSALSVTVYHFPGSRTGTRMAGEMARAISRRTGAPARPPASIVTYPLQQTACPAIVVGYPSIANIEEELRLDTSRYLREQAYGAFVGILEHFAAPDTAVVAVTVSGPDTDGWSIVLDDTWTLVTGSTGTVQFAGIGTGVHRLTAARGQSHHALTATVETDSLRVIIPVQ